MQYEVSTPSEYLDALAEDWRKDTVQEIRDLIKLKAPEIAEAINYKMLCYRDSKGVVFHLNAQKNYVSLYIGDTSKIDTDGSLLDGLDLGKGCIRLKKNSRITETKLPEFIELTLQYWKEGRDIYC